MPPARRDRRFAAQHAAVLELGDQRDQLARRRQHDAARADDARGDFHRRGEIVASRRPARSAPGCRSRGRSGRRRRRSGTGRCRRSATWLSESAARQLRMSPGGIMLNSARSLPELPPSSDVATMATSRSRVASRRAASREEQRAQAAQHVGQPGAAADRDDARQPRRGALSTSGVGAIRALDVTADITGLIARSAVECRRARCRHADRVDDVAHRSSGSTSRTARW